MKSFINPGYDFNHNVTGFIFIGASLQAIQWQMNHMTAQSNLFLTQSFYEDRKRRIKGEKQVFGCRAGHPH